MKLKVCCLTCSVFQSRPGQSLRPVVFTELQKNQSLVFRGLGLYFSCSRPLLVLPGERCAFRNCCYYCSARSASADGGPTVLDSTKAPQVHGPCLNTFTSQVSFKRAAGSPAQAEAEGAGRRSPPPAAGCQPSPRPQPRPSGAEPCRQRRSPRRPRPPGAERGGVSGAPRRTDASAGAPRPHPAPAARPGGGRRCEAGPGGRPASLLGDAGMFTGPAGAAGSGEEVGAAAGARAARQEPR